MNPLTFVLCALLATGQGPANEAGTVAAVAPQTCQGRHTVLFVGNSRVYYHNQPAMLESLARANGCEVEWRMVVEGGASLASHLQSGEALEVIAKGGWDWVVLNTQSTFGRVHLVDGLERAIAPPPEVFPAARDVLEGHSPGGRGALDRHAPAKERCSRVRSSNSRGRLSFAAGSHRRSGDPSGPGLRGAGRRRSRPLRSGWQPPLALRRAAERQRDVRIAFRWPTRHTPRRY